MTKQEKIRGGMREILVEDLIHLNITHEHAPPGKDCGDCGVSIEAQIAAANPLMSPIRSSGKKHRKCMDCWNEYIDGLVKRIQERENSQGVVIKVERELPPQEFFGDKYWEAYHPSPKFVEQKTKESMLKAGYVAVEPLLEEK